MKRICALLLCGALLIPQVTASALSPDTSVKGHSPDTAGFPAAS